MDPKILNIIKSVAVVLVVTAAGLLAAGHCTPVAPATTCTPDLVLPGWADQLAHLILGLGAAFGITSTGFAKKDTGGTP